MLCFFFLVIRRPQRFTHSRSSAASDVYKRQVWLGTAVLGLVLRGLVFGDGTAASFVIVTGAVLGVGLVGWRVAVGVRSNRAGS